MHAIDRMKPNFFVYQESANTLTYALNLLEGIREFNNLWNLNV